jgi:hypothetical protein
MSDIKLSLEDAYSYCKKYREEKKVRMFSQCWGCVKFSKGDPKKMCFYDPPDNNACKFVNKQAQKNGI